MSSGPLHPLLAPVVRVASVLVFGALLVALALGISPNIDTQLVQVGEWFWPGYANELRSDPSQPECDLADLDARLESCPAEGSQAPTQAVEGDPFAGDDPFADDAPADAPAADPFAGDDPFADDAPADAPAADGADPFAGDDPFADDAPALATTSAAECEGLRAFRDTCAARWQQYDDVQSRLTPAIRNYRTFEIFIGDLARFPYWKDLLVLVVLLGALSTTAHRMHIALREPRTLTEHVLNQVTQLAAHLFLLASNVADWQVMASTAVEHENPELPLIWIVGLTLLAAINVVHLVKPPLGLDGQGSPIRMLMVVPLYAYMVIGSGLYFLLVEQHASGQAIYLHAFLQVPSVYLGVGLYIWAGMLFSITRVATLTFGVLRPWQLPPALLAWLVVVLAALPTAYSGASGIFVLAAGAVVFTQLRKAGADSRLALAATAMSGSLGVVLAPCLVVVLISLLNNSVTTTELFSAGLYVFALTAVLTLIAFLWRNDQPLRMPPLQSALRGTGSAVWVLVPFIVIGGAVVLVYAVVFGTSVSEHTAMLVLPAVLLAVVFYDRAFAAPRLNGVELPRAQDGVLKPLVAATAESSDHVGALLTLMAASICLGGVVERTEIMELFPTDLGGPYITMVVLLFVMVLVGMTMDALGAVVLVSVSVAGLADKAGIHPVHFWMMVLVAFELGYLTPPVALNHLLARQVIGEESHVEDDDVTGFFARNEHLLLPVMVMGTALVLVAFVPFFFYTPGAP